MFVVPLNQKMESRVYLVLLLPGREIAAENLSLFEACAYIRAYNEAIGPGARQAVIAESPVLPKQVA